MDKLENLALVAQMIESAEKSLQSAKQMLREVLGGAPGKPLSADIAAKIPSLSVSGGGKVIEGVFDGQNMLGPDGKQYPVPANYASKSKLIEGDILKLTIADDGSFIYKQIGPVERRKMLGVLVQDERGDYRVLAEGKPYRVLLASLTYFKSDVGDEVTIIVPQETDATWAAVENVIKKGASSGEGVISGANTETSEEPSLAPEEEEL
jgi:bifunctional DNA-binding transcriptional regulator/antitoxin component of YhaV-PrlF toxin-antitoxin module